MWFKKMPGRTAGPWAFSHDQIWPSLKKTLDTPVIKDIVQSETNKQNSPTVN